MLGGSFVGERGKVPFGFKCTVHKPRFVGLRWLNVPNDAGAVFSPCSSYRRIVAARCGRGGDAAQLTLDGWPGGVPELVPDVVDRDAAFDRFGGVGVAQPTGRGPVWRPGGGGDGGPTMVQGARRLESVIAPRAGRSAGPRP